MIVVVPKGHALWGGAEDIFRHCIIFQLILQECHIGNLFVEEVLPLNCVLLKKKK